MAHFRGTSESHLINIHVSGDWPAGGRTITGKNIDDASREAGFKNQFAHTQSSKRSLLRRLQYDRVTCRKGRGQLPCLHQQREIPGNDLTDYAHWLQTCVAEIRPVDGNGPALDFVCPSCVVAIAG